MKKIIALLTLAVLTASPLTGFGQAQIESNPAYLPIDKVLDLKANPPQVNVNLPQFLLKDALTGLNNTNLSNLGIMGTELPDLVKDVKLIRVLVFEGNKTNRAALKKAMKTLRTELDAKWTSVVNVVDDEDNVGIYVMGDKSGEAVAGVAILVDDGDDAVIANVVGNVSIGKLIKVAAQSKMVPKDLLKDLQNAGVEQDEPTAPKKDKAKHHKESSDTPSADSKGVTNAPAEK
jgi:hypothetical protein